MERHDLITEILKITGHKRSLNPDVHFAILDLIDKYGKEQFEAGFNRGTQESNNPKQL